MTKCVEIPEGTPLILEGRLFAKELLDILDGLSLEGTRISDITSDVVGKLLHRDRSFFREFSNANEKSNDGRVIAHSKEEIIVTIVGEGVNAKLKIDET